MIHGTIRFSSVRLCARHNDGSFGTEKEIEKSVERHFSGVGKHNIKIDAAVRKERMTGILALLGFITFHLYVHVYLHISYVHFCLGKMHTKTHACVFDMM